MTLLGEAKKGARFVEDTTTLPVGLRKAANSCNHATGGLRELSASTC